PPSQPETRARRSCSRFRAPTPRRHEVLRRPAGGPEATARRRVGGGGAWTETPLAAGADESRIWRLRVEWAESFPPRPRTAWNRDADARANGRPAFGKVVRSLRMRPVVWLIRGAAGCRATPPCAIEACGRRAPSRLSTRWRDTDITCHLRNTNQKTAF